MKEKMLEWIKATTTLYQKSW